ncbi:hypothetical protein ABK040_008125 [Willaertia magna]
MSQLKDLVVILPIEIKYLIISYFPIQFLIGLIPIKDETKLEEIKYLLNEKSLQNFINNFIKNSLNLINKTLIFHDLDLHILKLNKLEQNLFLNLENNNFKEFNLAEFKKLKIISKVLLKINYLFFTETTDYYFCKKLQIILDKLNCKELEICWIFNKQELLKNNFYKYHNYFYSYLCNLIIQNDKFRNEILQNINCDNFRIHGMLFIKQENLNFDILQIATIDDNILPKRLQKIDNDLLQNTLQNTTLQQINFTELKLLKYFKNIKKQNNRITNEILFQHFTKGINKNILFEYNFNPKKDNLFKTIKLCQSYSLQLPFNYSPIWSWISNIKLIINPFTNNYYLKCYRSLLQLLYLLFGFEFLFVLFISFTIYFDKLSFFNFTKQLIFGQELSFGLLYDCFFEWYVNVHVIFVFCCFVIKVYDNWPVYWRDGLFKLFFVKKLTFCNCEEFKVNMKRAITTTYKKKSKKWNVIGVIGGIISAITVGLYYCYFK